MKQLSFEVGGWFLMLLFSFAVIVSPEGLNVAVSDAAWLSAIVQFVGNLIPAVAVLVFLLAAFLITMIVANEDYIPSVTATGIKQNQYDLEKAKKAARFKPLMLITSVVYWVLLIGSGWIISGLMMASAGVLFQMHQFIYRSIIDGIVEQDMATDELKEIVADILKKD